MESSIAPIKIDNHNFVCAAKRINSIAFIVWNWIELLVLIIISILIENIRDELNI